jgi:hypothetical protein
MILRILSTRKMMKTSSRMTMDKLDVSKLKDTQIYSRKKIFKKSRLVLKIIQKMKTNQRRKNNVWKETKGKLSIGIEGKLFLKQLTLLIYWLKKKVKRLTGNCFVGLMIMRKLTRL